MPSSRDHHRQISSRLPQGALGPACFFLIYFLCVWLVIDPRLIHHSLGIFIPYRPFAFDMRWPFFYEHLFRVGGLVDYATRLLTTLYLIDWAGALVTTAVAWGVASGATWLVRRAGRPGGRGLGYVAATIVLLLHSDYSQPLNLLLSLVAGLAAFALYVQLGPQSSAKRFMVLLLLFPFVYQIAGSGSLLLPVLAATDELFVRRNWSTAVAAAAWGLAVPWGFGKIFAIDMADAYAGFLFANPGVLPSQWPLILAPYLFFPAILAGGVLLPRLLRRGSPRSSKSNGRSETKSDGRSPVVPALSRPWIQFVPLVVCLCVIGVTAWWMSNSFVQTVLDIDYHSQHEQWDEALKAVERIPTGTYNVRCQRNILLALYHTGRLGDDMCRYDLRMSSDLIYTPERHRDLGFYYQESRLFFELGQVNDAERCAYEALERLGPHPAVLRQLASINIVKGRVETSRVFLGALACQPFHRREALDMLRRLEADPGLENRPRIRQVRATMIRRDRVVRYDRLPELFEDLLRQNPHNRMAFELLMAFYLSSKQPDQVAANIPLLKQFGATRVPLHYQEAWVVAAGRPNDPPPIPGFGLDPQVVERAQKFRRIMSEAASPADAAVAAWDAGLGDSYFFYLAYGFSAR